MFINNNCLLLIAVNISNSNDHSDVAEVIRNCVLFIVHVPIALNCEYTAEQNTGSNMLPMLHTTWF